ncbi:MAG: 4-hydroxythreonine-4-phosphate dehydrogenase PdxA [Bacteroidota bacterium]
MAKKQKIRLAISIGDGNGIGLEVIMKCFSDNRMYDSMTPIIYGGRNHAKSYKKQIGIDDFSFNFIDEPSKASPKKANLVDVIQKDIKVDFGQATKESGACALESLKAAVADLASNKVDVLVTAPINKSNIQSDQFQFPGHTEYLAQMANSDEVLMFMISNGIRIGVATGHIPVNEVAKSITKEGIVNHLKLMNKSLMRDFGIVKPKIAVLGLNPHAGDNGLLGDEEINIITPAIDLAKKSNLLAFGPFPADGFFGSSSFKHFDGILAMYHDQGLIPFKALTFESGINYTAGLPIVRTSPDHGTAYEIAGKNEASAASFRAACFAAIDIYRNRQKHKSLMQHSIYKKKSNQQKSTVQE